MLKVGVGSGAITHPQIIFASCGACRKSECRSENRRKKVWLFSKNYSLFINNGKEKADLGVLDAALMAKKLGAGELLVNNIDRDGTLLGFDNELISLIYDAVDIPITVLGGAGCVEDIEKLAEQYKVLGIAAGSLFVLTGKYRAVLIQYLSDQEKIGIVEREYKVSSKRNREWCDVT